MSLEKYLHKFFESKIARRISIGKYISKCLPTEDIRETSTYREATEDYEKRVRSLREDLEKYLANLNDANARITEHSSKNKELIADINKEREQRLEIIANAIREKEGQYQNEISDLRKEKDSLSLRNEKLEQRLEQRKLKFYSLAEQTKYLIQDRRQKMIELVKIRIGKGENPKYFNCPEAAGVVARENEELKKTEKKLESEIIELNSVIHKFGTLTYENIIDLLANSGDISPNFALIYINHERTVSRVIGEMEKFAGVNREDLLGKKSGYLLNLIGDKKTKRALIEDWDEERNKYRKISLANGKNADILVQKVCDHYNKPLGAVIYIATHRFLALHKSHKTIFSNIQNLREFLSNINVINQKI